MLEQILSLDRSIKELDCTASRDDILDFCLKATANIGNTHDSSSVIQSRIPTNLIWMVLMFGVVGR